MRRGSSRSSTSGRTTRGTAGAAGGVQQQQQFTPTRIVPHEQTNSLIIQAEPEEYDEVENLINEGIWEKNKFIKEVTDDDLCIICFQGNRDIAFLPCGHFCICLTCSKKYKDKKCLVCRKIYKNKQRIFR